MTRFLIADCGSTKIDWTFADSESDRVFQRRSPGINPFHQSEREIETALRNALFSDQSPVRAFSVADETLRSTVGVQENKASLPESSEISSDEFRRETGFEPRAVYFYGAGLTTQEKGTILRKTFREFFPSLETVETNSDLLAAARGSFQTQSGIACILGTGANSGLFDGVRIVDNVSAGGYILGDEGSGAWLGRNLLSDWLKREMPRDLAEEFVEEYRLQTADVLENVYRKPLANRYLASFSRFLSRRRDAEYCRALVERGMETFFKRNVAKYPRSETTNVGAVGSIAAVFADSFVLAAQKFGFRVESIRRSPTNGLILFHRRVS